MKRNESMMKWFEGLAENVRELSFEGEHATATGRRIQELMRALEDVEQFEVLLRKLKMPK